MAHAPDLLSPAASEDLLPDNAVPLGFRFHAARTGIKPSGQPDLACLVAPEGATAAAMFTSNRVVAAPVIVGREHLQATGGRVRAVVVNSGNANCATGFPGLAAARESCQAAAAAFGCQVDEVIPCSTGIIGVLLPVAKLTAALPGVAGALAAGGTAFSAFAQAILTTDTRPKVSYRTIAVDDRTVRLAGACKGAGMIHPRLAPPHATMLAYLLTDAIVDQQALQGFLYATAENTFNRISIDGDTSTNDTVLLLASGQSGVTIPATHARFQAALAEIDPAKLHITLNGLPVCENGGRAAAFDPASIHAAMETRFFTIAVDLGIGSGQCRFWTTDLTEEYVRINADYSS